MRALAAQLARVSVVSTLTGQATQDGLLDQRALALIGNRHRLDAHDALGKISPRQWLGRFTQLIVDQPKALIATKPNASCPLLPGMDLSRPEVRVEQLHGRVQTHQIRTTLDQLMLHLHNDPCKLRSLVAQQADDCDLGHSRSLQASTARRLNRQVTAGYETVVAVAT